MQKMNLAIRSLRTHSLFTAKNTFTSSNQQLDQKIPVVIFRKVNTISSNAEEHNMDKAQNPDEKTGDVMSHSFGEGYATRSDEEGFGGIYGGNQSASNVENDKKIHENHPAYDKSQGSEVKEKEKARHQTNIADS